MYSQAELKELVDRAIVNLSLSEEAERLTDPVKYILSIGGKRLRPALELIADITPRASGELFLYVNDAVLLWPGYVNLFYRNNSGKAMVKVTAILADAIIPNR